MNYISDFNRDENNPSYIDLQNKIEYHFTGFELPMTESVKRQLIARHGRPRRISLVPKVIENEVMTITMPEPSFEIQIIHRMPENEEPKSSPTSEK